MQLNLFLVFTITHLSYILSMPNKGAQEKHTENRRATPKRQQKGPYSLPITHQYILNENLHVIPLQKPHLYQNHQNPHQNRSVTQLVPIYSYIPLHRNYLVPVQDLQVIPLSRHRQSQQIHYRVESRNDEVNRFRTFRGGYGTGLYFGGHGAGHGFYIYG